MIAYNILNSKIRDNIFIPKYYNPGLKQKIKRLSSVCDLITISKLATDNVITISTGHEIGKMAYGTGDIPFIRTSDISNWELKVLPKQGVSDEIYSEYADKQKIRAGDVLFVRDGTYLIGTNCLISELDEKILFQSHILKISFNKNDILDAYLFFAIINTDIFQEQVRSVQFTADTIDTIGNRFLELVLPIPKDKEKVKRISKKIKQYLDNRDKGKAFIKQAPLIIEEILETNSVSPATSFLDKASGELLTILNQETVSGEFSGFETFLISSKDIQNRILLPKFYDPEIQKELSTLRKKCNCVTIESLVSDKVLQITTGDEIGKMAYGTGNIPFVRTSDFSNWELKYDPKQGVSSEIFDEYEKKQDVKAGDILLVRDGTYLVGSSSMVSEKDGRLLYCGGLYKIRVLKKNIISEWLLLALLNSYFVRKQMRNKQFTRDVIDTLGKRFFEIVIPIPKDETLRDELSKIVKKVFNERISSREKIKEVVSQIYK
ncbi:MAG: hypothetical protein KA785_05800 [Spirochaetaceae bacterium]|nr:hypothetical protein [Spirochaetaceae bacterium]